MIQMMLVLHVLVGAALLGALTHQSFSVARKHSAPARSFVDRFRAQANKARAVQSRIRRIDIYTQNAGRFNDRNLAQVASHEDLPVNVVQRTHR